MAQYKKRLPVWETLKVPGENDRVPSTLKTTRKVGDIYYVAGSGEKTARVMIVNPCPNEDEVDDFYGTPSAMRGAAGAMIRRILLRAGIPDSDYYYTSVLKWCPPRQFKPKIKDARRTLHLLEQEIEEIKPEVVICMGKLPFELLYEKNISLKKILGAWFWSDKFQCRLYVTDEAWTVVKKPDYFEKFLVDFREVRRVIYGVASKRDSNSTDPEQVVVRNMVELEQLTKRIYDEHDSDYLAVDMESGGSDIAPDGFVRSIQVSWHMDRGAYIRLYDDKRNYAFDASLRDVSKEVAKWYSSPKFKLAGHQLSADLTWIYFALGLDFYQRAGWDTLHAEHTIDESSELKLERLAVKYTNLGRYDMDLTLWKHDNKLPPHDGYAVIPDDILIPYGIKDVIAVKRIIMQQVVALMSEGTLDYFMNMCLPFTTDVFTEMSTCGLPVNQAYLDVLRDSFEKVENFLEGRMRDKIFKDLHFLLETRLIGAGFESKFLEMERACVADGDYETLSVGVRDRAGSHWLGIRPVLECMSSIRRFNIRSPDDLRKWLYDAKKLTPVKTTKGQGFSMAWEKVLELPEARQREYKPSVDKNTLKVLSAREPVLDHVLLFNEVGNITQNFLKAPTATGELQGVAQWVSATTKSIHPSFALTETGRSRTWNPNILNYNKVVGRYVERGFDLYNNAAEAGLIKGDKLRATGVRTIAQAPKGYCFVDSDWSTAEVVALAYISGDTDMIKTLTEPDRNFALLGDKPVRLSYEHDCPVPKSGRDVSLCVSPDTPGLAYKNGRLVHPKRDIHWEIAELVNCAPREKLNKDIHRQAGKVTNFSCVAQGALVLTEKRGYIPIENVKITDRVFDGREWVNHRGVVYKGTKDVYVAANVPLTEDHIVYKTDGEGIPWEEVCKNHAYHNLWWVKPYHTIGKIQHPCWDNNNISHQVIKNTPVYDILDAGPMHRFVCENLVISNCPYGATGSSIEMQIEVWTGVRPEPGTGEALLKARADRYPIAEEFLLAQERIPVEPGFYKSVSGRIRHFHYTEIEDVHGVSEYNKKQVLSPLVRQARNFPIQEIVGASMMRAQINMLRILRENGMRSRNPISLYDALLHLAPMDERWAIWNLHHHCMSYGIQWETKGGLLKFDIEPEMSFRWGDKHTEEEVAELMLSDGKEHPVALKYPLREDVAVSV